MSGIILIVSCVLVAVVLVVLKLAGYVGWSWWWVTAPVWGTWALGTITVVCVLLRAIDRELQK